MTEREQREFDELSSLIDSIENDDTMKRKMDVFSQRKQRKRRLQQLESDQNITQKPVVSTRPQPVSSQQLGQTVVLTSPSASNTTPVDATKTTVFSPQEVGGAQNEGNHETVVVNNSEIQTLLEQDTVTPRQSQKNKKVPILAVVLSLLAILMIGFGVYTIASGNGLFDNGSDTSDTTTQEFERLLNWAEGYNDLSEAGKRKIIDYEDIYNKCSDTQKAQIDAILKEKSGKTFNQLLALAQSNKKADSKNDDVKKAEKKAELREKISELQNELDVAKTTLQTTSDEMSAAEKELNSIQTKIDSANEKLVAAQNDLVQAQQNLYLAQEAALSATEENQADVQMKLKEAQTAYEKATEAYGKAAETDVVSLQQKYSEIESSYAKLSADQQSQQAQVDDLSAQIQALQTELSNL